ncbi:hypothetical protein IH982_02225 [Patescibacteria group bacterium]|nr:hypothetical protein [Patescibacteria group bacterium]
MVAFIFSLFSKNILLFILFLLVFLGGVFLAYFPLVKGDINIFSPLLGKKENRYLEIQELQTQNLSSFQELGRYFEDLAKKKGGGYAFDVLRAASIPPNIDMHLLAHVVGGVLYQQEGLGGIPICTHDFRNACSHSIVIGLFFEEGEAALDEIAKACRNAPGGSGAYTMCFHGLGHGVLAYTGYDLEKAINLCEKTGTPQYGNQEAHQCISGSIMEIINGVHDKELWEEQHKKYFKEENPLYPCSSDFMPDEARSLCYIYLTPHLFNAAGADAGFPTPADFKQAFLYCDKLPVADFRSRDACYGGFGKEFIGLALGRDIRVSTIEQITDEALNRVYEWCLLANTKEGAAACVVHATNSLYWGGENDRSIAIAFCNVIDDPYYQGSCFINLMRAVSYYVQDPIYRRTFCEELPSSYSEECRATLKVISR